MKFAPLFIALGLAMNAWAADAPAGKGSADAAPSVEEIQTIRKILELPPERLSRIRGAIEHIEKMPPGARKEFADKLAKFETATPEERRKLTKEGEKKSGGEKKAVKRPKGEEPRPAGAAVTPPKVIQ